MVLSLASCKRKKKNDPDTPTPTPVVSVEPLFNLNASEYITIDEKFYKNYDVQIKVNTVTDEEVDTAIRQILGNNKTLIEDENVVIEEGNVVSIFYNGYYIGENSEKVYFNGGSNVGGSPYALEIGSGAFIPGFESGLVGKKPADYSTDNPVVVEAQFPEDYHTANLAGKTAYFEVTFEIVSKNGKKYYGVYGLPELTEDYIRNELRFTDEHLAKYEGDTVVEKYRAYIRDGLKWYNVDVVTPVLTALEDMVWDGAVIKKYPEAQLKEAYNTVISKIEAYYRDYPTLAAEYTFDEFACTYFGVPKGSDWRAEAEKAAKDEIKIQLIIYYIMDVEGLKPSADEYAVLLDKYITNALAAENITVNNFSTEEEYNIQKEQKKAWYAAKYGEHYLQSAVYKSIWLDAVVSYANIIEITE